MKATRIIHFLTIVLVSVCRCNASASENDTPLPVPTIDAAASVGYFYVGGRYVGESGAQVIQGAMYVEVLRPRRVAQRGDLAIAAARSIPRSPNCVVGGDLWVRRMS